MSNYFSLNLGNIPKELKFLLEIITFENDKKFNFNSIESDIDWNLFLELAKHHRLYPILYSKLKMIDKKLIPPHIVQILYHEYKKNTFEMLHLSAEMEQISNLFSENNIRIIILKGPILALDFYGDISLRTSGDLDVLIPIVDLNKVDKLLLENGFVKEDSIETKLNDWRWRYHHLTYIHLGRRVKLEIHWRLNPGPGKEPSFNGLWERKRISTLTASPINHLGVEDLFFFLVTHGARHGWFRLRWLVDIHEIVRKRIDWTTIIKLLREYQYPLHIGGHALLLSSQLLKTPLNKDMRQLMKGKNTYLLAQKTIFYLEQMVNLHSDPLPEYISNYYNRYLFSMKSNYQKILLVLSIFYPAITDLKTIKLPKSLFFLYFPLRPFLWIIRKTRKHLIS